MTRLQVKYRREGPTEEEQEEGMEGPGPFEDEEVLLGDLKDASTLLVLAITDAPLKIVRYVYEDDPSQLTEDVFLDACRYCSSLDILEYLKKHVPPKYYANDKISQILRDIIDTCADMYDDRIDILSRLFPDAMVYSDNPDNYTGCPLDLVLNGDYYRDFPGWLIEDMMNCIPTNTIKGFNLPPSSDYQIIKSLVTRTFTTLTKSEIETFRSREQYWALDDFVAFFTKLLPAAKKLKTLELAVPEKNSPEQDLFAPFPVDWLKSCQISSLSLSFGCGSEGPDFGILPWLPQLKELKELELCFRPFEKTADSNFRNAICQVLSLGKLKSLLINVSRENSDGFYLPVLESIACCPNLTKFKLFGMPQIGESDTYQDKMITILENNTSLQDVWFSDKPYEASGTDRENANGKQRLIDYYVLLNVCRRGLARNSGKASDLIQVLSEVPENIEIEKRRLKRLDTERIRYTVAQVLYALLRESPGTWSANALGQERAINPSDRGLKRKAFSLPERSSGLV